MLETSCNVGLEPEGANYCPSETVINQIRRLFWKRKDNHNVLTTVHVVAKFATQWLFVFHFPEILLVTLN